MKEIPFTVERTHTVAQVIEQFEDKVQTGEHTDNRVCIAGRLMLRRGQGKLVFGQLHDSSGVVQLFAPADVTPDFEDFTSLSLGDWIGVEGTVMKTRKGELSIQVEKWDLLAHARRAFPDKWHGLTDTDARYRQRYVDLWVNPHARAALIMRARIPGEIRKFYNKRGYQEVETPMLNAVHGGAIAKPFVTHHDALDMQMYLRIATELYLKRLVVGGMEKVYEIGQNFRNEGISPRHNPEFVGLESYEAYADYNNYMELVEDLVSTVAVSLTGSSVVSYQGREIDLTPPYRRATLTDLVSEAVGRDVSLDMDVAVLRKMTSEIVGEIDETWSPGKMIFEIYEKIVERNIWEPTFVMDMPKEVSPLARDHRTKPGFTEHSDLVIAGRELAPIYTELCDPDEQRARLEQQSELNKAGDAEAMVVDQDFLRALEYGMPPTAGMGLGVDRLAMLLSDSAAIKDVLFFPTLRPRPDDE